MKFGLITFLDVKIRLFSGIYSRFLDPLIDVPKFIKKALKLLKCIHFSSGSLDQLQNKDLVVMNSWSLGIKQWHLQVCGSGKTFRGSALDGS